MDLGASLAFVSQPAEADIMTRPPRDPRARFLDRSMLTRLFAGALTLAVIVFAAFWVGLGRFDLAEAGTLALVAWLVGHTVLGAVMAGRRGLGGLRGLVRNPALRVWLACALAFAALLVAFPALHQGLGAAAIPTRGCRAVRPRGGARPVVARGGRTRWTVSPASAGKAAFVTSQAERKRLLQDCIRAERRAVLVVNTRSRRGVRG